MDKKLTKIIILLASVQFIFTLDTTFMNVSISTLVKDLNTTVTGVQGAITLYTLVMAAFMIAGAKIGDIIGRKKAFIIGLSIYAAGSLITSLSQNITQLMFGWSFLEGIGAALAIPAMFSLITGNFKDGVSRAKAYGILAAMAAVGAAAGPIVGGLLTTYASWRYGFAAEVLVALIVLFNHKTIADAVSNNKDRRFDIVGFLLSASGLAVIVWGILLANTYGLLKSRGNFSIFGIQISTQGGLSPTIYFVITGMLILGGFLAWQYMQLKKGRPILIHPSLFKIRTVRAGSTSILIQQFIMAGIIFTISILLQISLGYNAFQTGLTILPLSIFLLVFASIGARVSKTYQPRSIVMSGFAILVFGSVFLGLRADSVTSGMYFFIPLAIMGIGLGLSASQLNNLIQSSVETNLTNEASGLSSTFQNLGSSLGTALAGSVMIAVLISASTSLVSSNTVLNNEQKQQYDQALTGSVEILSNAQVSSLLVDEPQDVINAVVDINDQARTKALSATTIVIGIFGSLGILSAARLPKATKPKAIV